jgi:hypothetical protein
VNTTQNSGIEWPTSALAAAERAFTFLTVPPAPLALDGRVLGHGLPARHIALDELRDLLVHNPATSYAAKDTAWHLLIDHARTWGPAWVVATVGMALPALTGMARRLCAGYAGQADDIESELLAGFLQALRDKDLAGPAPYARLCWAGWRAAHDARRRARVEEMPAVPDPSSQLPTRPYGHPDLVLGRAVHAGVISDEQAELISATRLGRVLVEDLAARHGVDASVLRMRRRRGELAVVRAFGRRAAGPPADPRPARPRSGAGQCPVRAQFAATRRVDVEGAREVRTVESGPVQRYLAHCSVECR